MGLQRKRLYGINLISEIIRPMSMV